MCNPGRAGFLGRVFGVFSFLSVFALSVWLVGCASKPVIVQDMEFWDNGISGQGRVTADVADALLAGAEALCRQAIDLMNAHDIADTNALNQAIYDSFRWAHQLVPDNTNVLEVAMFHLVERSLFNEAYAIAQQYLARHPNEHRVRYAAACCADAAGKPEIAAEQCAIIYAAEPDDRALAEALIRLYFQSGQNARALETLRASFERHPDAASKALSVKWAVFFASQQKNFEMALQCIGLALELWTLPAERSPIWTLAGECHAEMGQITKAADCFCKAFEEDDSNMLAIQRLGVLCARHPDVTNHVNVVFEGLKQPDVAKLLLQASIEQVADKPAAIGLLREAHAQSMRHGHSPGESFYLWLVMLLDAEKRSEEAITILKEAAATHPSSPEIKNCLAYLWAERGENLLEANRLINDALQVSPENAAYLDTKGWILFKLNRPFDALQYLLKAAELQPNEPIILDHTGDALAAIGRRAEAIKFWKKSNQLLPNPDVEKKFTE